MPDVEVLGWRVFMLSAVVRPVGYTAKFSKTMLEAAYGREHSIIWHLLWCTFLQSACLLHASSNLAIVV
jgi:hypothetical protein